MAPLAAAHIGPVEAGTRGEFLLRHAAGAPQLAQARAEDPLRAAPLLIAHTAIVSRCGPCVYGLYVTFVLEYALGVARAGCTARVGVLRSEAVGGVVADGTSAMPTRVVASRTAHAHDGGGRR